MRWFTSDHHFGHANIIDFCDRPFEDVEEMNEALVWAHNQVVWEQDQVYFLGDICMGKVKESLQYIKRMKGSKFLVPGNHDKVWKGRPKWEKHVDLYRDAGFIILESQHTVKIAEEEVLLCHFPYFGDSHGEDRFTGMRPDDEGGWLLCGHVHDAWDQKNKMINVGVDVRGFLPMSEVEVAQVIRTQ